MIRRTLLALSTHPRLFRYVRESRLARRLSLRFVAGETVDDAVAGVRALNQRGIAASMDQLGESVASAQAARATATQYTALLERIATERLAANVSIKLTALGLDIDEELCVTKVQEILGRARELGAFVRIDMEGSAYTERTITLFHECFYPAFPDNVGLVLQSYLYRTADDVEGAIARGCRVRLCKGAYREPASVAYPRKPEVDANYVRCMQRLLRAGNYPGIATHDERIIRETIRLARAEAIVPERFEFQMLYGVRRDLQERLVREGWRMRVYVPFGSYWYPYLMRRLAERPANVFFIVGNIARERMQGVKGR
jgi:proline dehydrogenase